MDKLIDIEYFKGSITIPNLNKDEGDDFNDTYIGTYQENYLQKALGYTMFKEFETELEKDEGDIPQIWKDLRDGVEYDVTIDGNTIGTKWNGFKNDEEISPIAYFVYFKWIKENYAQLTGTGVGVSNKENATNYPPIFKSTASWNKYIKLTGNIKDYVTKECFQYLKKYKNKKYYREDLSFIDDSVKLDQSLFMFLYHHRDDFTNWIFTNDIRLNVYEI